MARVHPQSLLSSAHCYFTSKQEVFTIWMKSLVLHGKGCTVFDSNGGIVYRVDNYDRKFSNEVYLMDFRGKVLYTILRKGYCAAKEIKQGKPGFRVRSKTFGILRGGSPFKAVVGLDKNQPCQIKIEKRTSSNSTCKIVDELGLLVAEVKRKTSKCGVVLGDDVLTMVVEPYIDHSLVMGLLVVYGLINHKM
ncbi:Protein LURP-one-related 3 [Vitis vinifera]|uniref:Protein LURP-one-related 3 n=1 Tax=Vitis vinifera TaxID=29760 RepID=A0A438K773_VITVI|nr:Protein LURP-one-related 3 [Vitis vinifera]